MNAELFFFLANSEIDQKITTPEKPFTSQPDTTKGRKTGNVYFFIVFILSICLKKKKTQKTMFVSMVLDTILVSRSFMDSTFEIPTSTSSRILPTGENLKKQKLLSSFF